MAARVQCAGEDGTCQFSGTKTIRYGTSTRYAEKVFTTTVRCSNSVFGDPAPGYNKVCSYESTQTTPAPAPTPQTPSPAPAPAPSPSTGTRIQCADEDGTCQFSGTKTIRYGTSTRYVEKVFTTTVRCSNSVFGDPAPGYNKVCTYLSNEVIPTPTPTAPAPSPAPAPAPSPSPAPAPVPPAPSPTPTPTLPNVAAKMRVSVDDLEVIGPFSSWLNAKTLGAVGNGTTDDTAVIQAAIENLGKPGRPAVLYFPAGTYRLTRTLQIVGNSMWGMTLIGENPNNTTFLWDGPQGGTMLNINGGFNSRLSRITWNGNKKAGIGVTHWYNVNQSNLYGGSSQHVDEVFVDMSMGIMAGRMGDEYGQLDSEGEIRRVKFIRNTVAGFSTGSWNALDWWIWDSEFTDCARGVSNEFSADGETGAGNFMIYRSVFRRSTVADITIGNTQWFSIHNNVSIGSRRFFEGGQIGANSAAVIMQNNRILDTTNSVSIYNGNVGPVTMIDNEVRSLASVTTGPVVLLDSGASGQDGISVGNKFTVSQPIGKNHAEDRILAINEQTVSRSAISSDIPTVQASASNFNRRVFEVAVGASADVIQLAINSAASSGSEYAIVHLPAGNYNINKTIIVPALKKIQIAGDSLATMLWWNGADNGIVFDLQGPSQAIIRDLRIVAQNVTAFNVSKADQATGRIFSVGSSFGPLNVQNLENTRLEFQATSTIKGAVVNNSQSVMSTGAGQFLPLTITGNSNVHVSDTWYEGDRTDLFRGDSGNFSFLGGHLAPADLVHGGGNSDSAILLRNYSGKVSFVGFSMNVQQSTNGILIDSENANTAALFLGMEGNKPNYFTRDPAGMGQVGFVSSKLYSPQTGSSPLANQGQTSNNFILSQLEQMRSIAWDSSVNTDTTASATNLRFYRVFSVDTKGIVINGK